MILGPEKLDDAGVIDLGNGIALVQTVDFFPPIVDDPFEFGQIAAANSLSDIYAMGATPLSALNIVGFPRKQLDISVLGDILAGGASKMVEANVALLGGHTVEDSEVKYGLAVTGTIDPAQLKSNEGARPGDILVLTKPLGMGAVSTSIQQGKEDPAHAAAAIKSMATLNAGAARAMAAVDSHAGTDITGFGLLGHGSEIARASNVTLRFQADKLPLTLGARELAAAKCLSGGAGRSRAYLGEHAHIASDVPTELADLAFDAETSGGLMIVVAPDDVDKLIKALEDEGTLTQAIIGEVAPADGEVWVSLE